MDKKATLAGLAALAQSTRLDVFRLLARSGRAGLPAGVISQKLGVVQNTMSAHLSVLSNAGLVTRTRSGRTINYAVNEGAIRGLMTYLVEDCCDGRPHLCGPLKTGKMKQAEHV